MELLVLGPLEVRVDGRQIPLGAAKQRAVLAMLALRANTSVSADELMEGLWGEHPPASAPKMVQQYVSQLRRVLAEDDGRAPAIVTRGRGYELRISPEDVDAARFVRLVERGAARQALSLWRGGALDDIADEPFAAAEIRRLDELRLNALERAIDADLADGRHGELVAELEALVAEHPLSERLHGQLMLALYRSGRQAEALEAYRRARERLVEDVGVEPGPDLQRLHAAVLSQDPSLDADWARKQAEVRVSAEALRTADERADLRRAESRLSGSVADLQSVRALGERREMVGVCPYKGLASFGRDDAAFFFGRERLVAELVARLVGSPLVGIVGASGSGKSSLLRAGLLAELDRGVLPGSEAWTQVLMRPGEHPHATLRQATAGAVPGGRLLLAVDQFEETFTLCRDQAERALFLAALVAAVGDPLQEATVVLAVRADFYGRCAEDPELAALLGDGQMLVGAMRRDELRRAIELPADRAGLEVEPELVEALLTDTADEPGALPLLSTALLELWQHRDGSRLGLAGYERTGGVQGAVARMAERAYGRLEGDQQRVARRIFLRLAGDGEDGVRVRRRVPLDELEADRVLDLLADSRLVTVSEGSAEVAHEALLREWPRLRGWLEEDADGRRLHAHLMHAAREWSRDDRDRGGLYRGARLASALEWRAAHEPELNAIEHQFLDASRAANERERRRIKLVLAGVLALLVLTAGAALLALDQRGRARAQTRTAEAQRLGAQALNADTVDFSLLLARQAVALADRPATEANLLNALRRSPAAVGVIRPGLSSLVAIARPAGGEALAVSDANGAVAFLDPAGRRRLALHRSPAGSLGGPLVSAPDGTRVAVAGFDSEGGYVDLFDPRTRRHVAKTRLNIYYAQVESAVFTPDSRELLVQAVDDETANRIWRVDARTGRLLRIDDPAAHDETQGSGPMPDAGSRLLGFAGSRLVTYGVAGGIAELRNATTLRSERRLPFSGRVAELNPALGLVACGGDDGAVRLLDLRSGRMRTADGRHDAPVTALAFSADGRRLVTAGRDEQLIVWDTVGGVATETLQARGAGIIDDLTVAPDGSTAYSAGRDGTVVTWDLRGDRRLERTLLVDGRPLGGQRLVTSARGDWFVVVDRQGSIDVFESRTLRHTGRIPLEGRHRSQAAAISPDGRTLAVTDLAGRVGFWDLGTRRPLAAPLYAHAGDGYPEATFSGDGRWLVTGGGGDILRLWDARRQTMRDSFIFSGAEDLSLNPEGTLLAATLLIDDFAGGLQLISVPDLETVRRVPAPRGTLARFTPDGRSLIYGDREGRVWIYDTRTWKPRATPLFVSSPILTAEFSPDGRRLATTSADGEVRLWDVESGRPVAGAPPRARSDPTGAGFIDGGRQMAVLHDRAGSAWDLSPATWARHACAVAGRTLTRAEWESALPDQGYAPACAKR
jgi:DNA-binding SARP family transcriptional activator/WD40 repeat protein